MSGPDQRHVLIRPGTIHVKPELGEGSKLSSNGLVCVKYNMQSILRGQPGKSPARDWLKTNFKKTRGGTSLGLGSKALVEFLARSK